MLTLWAYAGYAKRPTPPKYLVVAMLFACGLMAKAMLVTLPAIMLLLDVWPLGRLAQDGPLRRLPTLILEKIPLFMLSGLTSVITLIAQREGGSMIGVDDLSIPVRIANALVAYTGYIRKMFWPVDLAVFYPHPGMPSGGKLFIAGIFLAAVSVAALISVKKYPWFLIGWLWYLGALVPVIGLVQVGAQAMADRYTYFPLIGLFIILVWGMDAGMSGWRSRQRVFRGDLAAIFSLVLLLIAMMGLSFRQVTYWKDSVTLFSHALEVTAENSLAHNNLGIALMAKGRISEAETHFRKAIAVNPNYAYAHIGLGKTLIRKGDADEAMTHFFRAVRSENPEDMARALTIGLGIDAAGIEASLAVPLSRPQAADLYFNIAMALMRMGRYDQAAEFYKATLRLDPFRKQAHNNLGVTRLHQGRPGAAVDHFRAAIVLDPYYEGARHNLTKAMAGAETLSGGCINLKRTGDGG
ncbi:MAG: tetratricopeptide repeat protein [Desulfobacterales bacterium]|nr:tetratricopeptide repeat protein [Desulfobacterales bacterium]